MSFCVRAGTPPTPGACALYRAPRTDFSGWYCPVAHSARADTCATGRESAVSGRYLHRADCLPRRSEEHTSELQSQSNLVCRLLLEKNNTTLTLPQAVLDAMQWPRCTWWLDEL